MQRWVLQKYGATRERGLMSANHFQENRNFAMGIAVSWSLSIVCVVARRKGLESRWLPLIYQRRPCTCKIGLLQGHRLLVWRMDAKTMCAFVNRFVWPRSDGMERSGVLEILAVLHTVVHVERNSSPVWASLASMLVFCVHTASDEDGG